MEYSSKFATEGVPIQELFGSGTLPRKGHIVIMDVAKDTGADKELKIPGLNGASYINSALTNGQMFQARMLGYKGVLNPINIGGLVKEFTGNEDGRLAVRGIDGRTQYITKDTDLVLNAEDLKAADIRFNGMKYEDILNTVYENIENGGLYINKTADMASKTSMKWIPAQLAQTLSITPRQSKVFADAFWDLFRSVGTPIGAVEHIFGKDSAIKADLLSENGAAL